MSSDVQRSIRAACAALLLSVGVDASPAAVWRVGATRAITQIQPAVDAASDGDLVLVDPGVYDAFEIVGKGITVAAENGSFTLREGRARSSLGIRAVPTGASVTVAGAVLRFRSPSVSPLWIQDCTGAIRLLDLRLEPSSTLDGVPIRAVVEIERCASVWLTRLVHDPQPGFRQGTTTRTVPAPWGVDAGLHAVLAEDSRVLLADCVLRGYDNDGVGLAARSGGDALRLVGTTNAFLQRDQSILQGGTGREVGGSAVHWIQVGPADGAFGCATDSSTYRPGAGPLPGGRYSIDHDRGVIQRGPISLDRNVPSCLEDFYGEVEGPSLIRLGSRPFLVLRTRQARTYMLFLGATRERIAPVLGSYNPLILDPTAVGTAVVATGAFRPPYAVTLAFVVPVDPSLVGVQLAAQALLGAPSGATQPLVSCSLPEALVILP